MMSLQIIGYLVWTGWKIFLSVQEGKGGASSHPSYKHNPGSPSQSYKARKKKKASTGKEELYWLCIWYEILYRKFWKLTKIFSIH